MAERTENYQVEKTRTFYECDKCHGRNHEETEREENLNKVVFGAQAQQVFTPKNPWNAHNNPQVGVATGNTELEVYGEHEYLLCDDCMERAHDYLTDFF